jgi:hypothetical protein
MTTPCPACTALASSVRVCRACFDALDGHDDATYTTRAEESKRDAKRKNLAPGELRMTKKERKAVRALASMGGHARAASLTPEDRQAIAKKAAAARWRDKTKPPYNL